MRLALVVASTLTVTSANAQIAIDIWDHGDSQVSIVLLGEVKVGDAERFRKVLVQQLRAGKWIAAVFTNSPGGSMMDGIGIGEQIRKVRASTTAPNYLTGGPNVGGHFCTVVPPPNWANYGITFHPKTGKGDPRCTCTSACFAMWAGGYGRQGNVLGVHRMRVQDFGRLVKTTEEAKEVYDRLIAAATGYFKRMDVPDYVIRMATVTSSADIHFLSKSELAPMVGNIPHTEELINSRCPRLPARSSPNFGELATQRYYCARTIDEEESRIGGAEYLAEYGD
jgi:hypothetical protein